MKRVYGVAIRKGGQGKSTTVSTLARLCAIQGARVLVVDLAQPGSTTTSFRDLWPDAEHVDLSQCLLAFRDFAPGTQPTTEQAQQALAACALPVRLNAMPSWSGGFIAVLPHDELLAEAAAYLPTDRVLANLLHALGEQIDLALIDYPADGAALLANALAATDEIIMPLAPEAPALEGADATLRLLARVRQAGHAIALGGILLTRCDPRNKRAADIVRTLTQSGEVEREPLQRKLLPFAVRHSEYYEQAFRYGVPVWDRTEDPAHWAGYALLADWVLRRSDLIHLAATPRMENRLEPATHIVHTPSLGLGKPEIEYRDFQRAHAPVPA